MNPRHPAPKAGALPTALHPDNIFVLCGTTEIIAENGGAVKGKADFTVRAENIFLFIFHPSALNTQTALDGAKEGVYNLIIN